MRVIPQTGDDRARIYAWLALPFAFLCLLGDGAFAEEPHPSKGLFDGWSVSFSPYAWGAGMKGTIAAFPRAPATDVDVSFSDILKHLELGAMVLAEVRYQRFAAYTDLIYTSISGEQESPFGILFKKGELNSEIFIGTFGGAYRPLETEHASLDLLAGARAWSVDTDLKLHGRLVRSRDFSHNETWVDPVIGFSGRYRFDNGIFLTNLAHVGGFGVGSDLTWDVFGGIGYQFNDTISALAGYRHLEVDYQHNGFKFDVELSGPVVGMTIKF